MNRQKVFRSVLSVAGALALWWLSSITLFNPILVPAPHKVAVNIWQMTADGEILFHAWASLRRVLVGYAFGSVLGILTGIAVARIRIAEDILEPPLQFVRNITPVAIIPMAVNAFGLEESSKYFVIIYSTIIPVVFNTVAGVASTPRIRVRAAMCLGAGRWDIFLRVVLPSAWPFILTGIGTPSPSRTRFFPFPNSSRCADISTSISATLKTRYKPGRRTWSNATDRFPLRCGTILGPGSLRAWPNPAAGSGEHPFALFRPLRRVRLFPSTVKSRYPVDIIKTSSLFPFSFRTCHTRYVIKTKAEQIQTPAHPGGSLSPSRHTATMRP